MRIDSNHGAQPTAESGSAGTQNAAVSRGTARSIASIGEDEAQLSGANVQVQALAAQSSQLPEVRQERVSALRQAVLSGQYQTSPENVAGAMFDQMLAASFA